MSVPEGVRRSRRLQGRNPPGSGEEEDLRDWAGGVPGAVLAQVAGQLVAAEARGHGLTLMAITCRGWKDTLKEDAVKAAGGPEVFRDWGNRFGEGLPDQVLEMIAAAHVAQTEALYAAFLKLVLGYPEDRVQKTMAKRKAEGNCLFVLALVCKEWRKAQLKVGGPLRTRVHSDVTMPGQVALVKWALAEGCPRVAENGATMLTAAAQFGQMEQARWLIQEQGFAMDRDVMHCAVMGGNLELVKWLQGEGCPGY